MLDVDVIAVIWSTLLGSGHDPTWGEQQWAAGCAPPATKERRCPHG
jgi:hypothetical protein